MDTIEQLLNQYPIEMLRIVANRWDVDLESDDPKVAASQLSRVMLRTEKAEQEWERLPDQERLALQVLLGAQGRQILHSRFIKMYGEIRLMGADRLAREKPHLSPNGIGEKLFFGGFCGITTRQTEKGIESFVYVPTDLAESLPTHKTGYDLTQPLPSEDAVPDEPPQIASTTAADTTIVDDFTTLLAYLQTADEPYTEEMGQALADHLIGPQDYKERVDMMMNLALELQLITQNAEGFWKPVPEKAKKWLEKHREQQIRSLAEAWQRTPHVTELHYINKLTFESDQWLPDPTLARNILRKHLATMPQDWFALEQLIESIKTEDPDFQRPGGNYDSWYIRDAETDLYLRGVEYWDRIDGATLKVIATGPLHWLGLVSLAESEAGEVLIRLNAYGRAHCSQEDWPNQADKPASLQVEPNGLVRVSRQVSRYKRFQVTRFTDWGPPMDKYEYQITSESMDRATEQGVQPVHIQGFLTHASDRPLPPQIIKAFERRKMATTEAELVISNAVILEADTPEQLEQLLDDSDLRRFFGARLGGRAVIVRKDQWQDLMDALQERHILFENRM